MRPICFVYARDGRPPEARARRDGIRFPRSTVDRESALELRQLRQFVAVAEAGSFSGAAKRLCMAQPPLSMAIRKLETEIGATLFDRSLRGVRLTPSGFAALISARKCLRNAEEVVSAALAADAEEAGYLCVAFIGSVTFGLMPRIVQAFRARFPNVKLELREATNREVLAAVQNGSVDLGFVRLPALCPPGVAMQSVEKDLYCIALPLGHRLSRKRSLRVADLAGESFIGYLPSQAGSGLHGAVMQIFREVGVSPNIVQEAVQVHTVIGLVESGLGVALVPSVITRYASHRVVFRPLCEPAELLETGIALAYSTTSESGAASRFRSIVGELVSEPAGVRGELQAASPPLPDQSHT
jgi:DNA-binding transcriptional LysR family regulator